LSRAFPAACNGYEGEYDTGDDAANYEEGQQKSDPGGQSSQE